MATLRTTRADKRPTGTREIRKPDIPNIEDNFAENSNVQNSQKGILIIDFLPLLLLTFLIIFITWYLYPPNVILFITYLILYFVLGAFSLRQLERLLFYTNKQNSIK